MAGPWLLALLLGNVAPALSLRGFQPTPPVVKKVQPKIVGGCATTQFGCCPGSKKAASGPNYAGCEGGTHVVIKIVIPESDYTPPELSEFEVGCYYKEDPDNEKGGGMGKSYRGLMQHTASGRVCKRWTAASKKEAFKPIADSFEPIDPEKPEGTKKTTWGNGVGNHNFCRNPDQSEEKPWCYTEDPNPDHHKEVCDIPVCSGEKRNFKEEAKRLGEHVAEGLFCECADQLYGSTTTTKDTYVPLVLLSGKLGKVGESCDCPDGSSGVLALVAQKVGTSQVSVSSRQ